MQKENTPENGRRDVMKVAPDQAKTSGSLRPIFDTWIALNRIRRRLEKRHPILTDASASALRGWNSRLPT